MTTPTLKRILVTGANKGIGKAVVERLLSDENDDTFVYLGSRSLERGKAAVEDITKKLGCDESRLQCLELDTSSDESVVSAASKLSKEPSLLYGIINNAGIGWGYTLTETLNTNYFGVRRVNEKMAGLIQKKGRIVNVASASGPNFVSSLDDDKDEELKKYLSQPWTIPSLSKLDEIARTVQTSNAYGVSKALLNAYTYLDAKLHDEKLIINSCTPGWIATDLTAGTAAKNPPEMGAIPPCFLMMDKSFETLPTGRYYGSDCVRSPMHFYRDPGSEPYESDEDLVGWQAMEVTENR